LIYLLSKPDHSAAEDQLDDDLDSDRIAYLAAFDPTRDGAVEGEALSAILGRVMIAILDAMLVEEIEPSERAAIRRGIDDARTGRRRP
jgi:hypothetical protein